MVMIRRLHDFNGGEDGGLKPPTPYMRNDSASNEQSSKKRRKRRKVS
jgi:hypothetical protein